MNIEVELIEIDLLTKEQKADWFVRLNPFGQVPVLVDDDTVLWDSQAILKYLAQTYAPEANWYGQGLARQAKIDQYLAVAAEKVSAGPAKARVMSLFNHREGIEAAQHTAQTLLAVLEQVVANQTFLIDDQPSIADIACYAYIKRAPEGGIELTDFHNLRKWLTQVELLPGFIAMPEASELLPTE